MGVWIKAATNGFRRCGIAHSVKGKYYPDGFFSDEQLAELKREPQLLVTVQAERDLSSGQNDRLLQEMGDTIAGLEHDLEGERAGLNSAVSTLAAIREHLVKVPSLVLDAARLREPAEPGEGVISIKEDALAEIIVQCLKEKSDASQSTPASSGSPEAPPTSAPDSPVPPATGDAGPVKAANKRAATTEKKGAGE